MSLTDRRVVPMKAFTYHQSGQVGGRKTRELSKLNSYKRTDLAAELDLTDRAGITESETSTDGFRVSEIVIVTDEAAKRLSKPKGRYITIDVGKLWLETDDTLGKAAKLIASKLSELARELVGHAPESVMVIGLGNRRITADALGDETCGLLTVTRHVKSHKALYELLGGRELSALTPGVLGQTGIESAELAAAACEHVKPELVVAIDSLCARSTDRLATTVQLGSTGISPGSGIGNRRLAINAGTLKVPVIALGIPTVVDSSTLVWDALEKAGIDEPCESLRGVLENQKSFFVTPKETDTIVRELSRLCAGAITAAFS